MAEMGGVIDYMYSLWNADTMPLWFVRELIFFSLLAPIYYQVKNRLWLSVLVSIVLIILATLNIVEYRSFLYWTPVYLVGASLNKNRVVKIFKAFEKNTTKYLLFLFLIIYCLGAWFLPNGVEKENAIYSMEFVIFRLSTPLAFTVIIYSIVECKVRVRKWMHYSFFVYCMHAPIIKLLSMIYCKIVPSFYGGELVQFFVVIALTYTVCVVLAMSLERYMSPVWKFLNGNRL